MAIDITTQRLVDKIRRNTNVGTDTDEAILLRISDAFDPINSDTSSVLAFVDEVDYVITPDLSPVAKADYRQALYLKTKFLYFSSLKESATGKAVRVKSGRDEVDTTKAMGGYDTTLDDIEKEYLKVINRINGKTGAVSEILPAEQE